MWSRIDLPSFIEPIHNWYIFIIITARYSVSSGRDPLERRLKTTSRFVEMGAAENISCTQSCTGVPRPVQDGNCQYICNSTVHCHYQCLDHPNNNSTAPLSQQPGDLLVFLETPTTLEGLIFLLGNTVSMLCLTVTVIIHVFLRKRLWTLQGRSLVSLIAALFMAKLAFQVNPYFNFNKYLCSFVSVIQHYFCLSAFLWLSVLVYTLWKFSHQSDITISRRKDLMRVYMVFAWGTPFTLVVVCILVEFLVHLGVNYGNQRYCSVLGDGLLLYSLAGPLGVVTLLNLVLFVMILLRRVRKMQATSGSEDMTLASRRQVLCGITDLEVKGHSLVAYLKMSLLMLAAWMTGFAASNKEQFCTHWFCDWWVFFIILNALQGIFILMNFCLNKDVYQLLHERSYLLRKRLTRSGGNIQRPRRPQRETMYGGLENPVAQARTTGTNPEPGIQTVSGVVNETSNV